MKCPNCGFVTFPDPAECKRCGQRFDPPRKARDSAALASSITFRSPERPLSSPISTLEPGSARRLAASPAEPATASSLGKSRQNSPRVDLGAAFDAGLSEVADGQGHAPDTAMPKAGGARPLDDEIAARVARYRRRRYRIQTEAEEAEARESKDTLRFDFNRDGPETHTMAVEAELSRPDPHSGALDVDLDPRPDAEAEAPLLDSTSLNSTSLERYGIAAGPRENSAEWGLEPRDLRPSHPPVEVVLHSGASLNEPEEDPPGQAPLGARLGRRFAAGMVDGAVLLVAAAVFFGLFRASGGHLDRQTTDLAILGFAAALLVVFYFWAFTALAFATPGQSAFGLGVRTLDGDLPDAHAAFWRGLGYLVSAASLMLGFVWPIFDSERLSWHDHMSGTCLVELSRRSDEDSPVPGAEAS